MAEDRIAPQHGQGQPERLLTVSDAAQELGISAEAVRSRVKRGTLGSVKEGSTVYVLLPQRPGGDQTTAAEHDHTSAPTGARGTAQEELVESLSDQVAYMREQLAEEREARRRADTIIAQLSQANAALARRVPEIEAPVTDATEATGGASESGEGAPYGTSPKRRRILYRGAPAGGVGSLGSSESYALANRYSNPALMKPAQPRSIAPGPTVAHPPAEDRLPLLRL